ncbi:hypothetical protein ADMFC3_03000 [Geovibrio sp. ADMFC3]
MRMSKKTEYAVHSLVIIACNSGSHIQLEELAERQNIIFEDTPKSISCQFTNRSCDAEGMCEITKRVGKAFEKLYEELEQTTLADLIVKADISRFSLNWLKG